MTEIHRPLSEIDTPKKQLLSSAERTELAQYWVNIQSGRYGFMQIEPIPDNIASEVALSVQKKIRFFEDDGFLDGEYNALRVARSEAVDTANTLDAALLNLSLNDWPFHIHLNRFPSKFHDVDINDLQEFLGSDEKIYDYRSLHIRDILAQHAPYLLPEKVKIILDFSQPLWKRSSTYALILMSCRNKSSIRTVGVESLPLSLPVSSRTDYLPEVVIATKPVGSMESDELRMFVGSESIEPILERGFAQFGELNLHTQESVMTNRLFEVVAKSKTLTTKNEASERNKALTGETGEIPLQLGDYVHATRIDILKEILSAGLRCGEAIIDNDRTIINYPFTVSFLEVDEQIAEYSSTVERLDALKNQGYGAINIVLHRDADSTDYGLEQRANVPNQRQIFGGVPSTEIKAIIVRQENNEVETKALIDQTIAMVIENGMFIPVYSSKGELLLSSEQFNSDGNQGYLDTLHTDHDAQIDRIEDGLDRVDSKKKPSGM